MIWTALGLAVAWGAVASQLPGQQIPTSANAYVAMAPDPMSTAAIPRGGTIAPVSGDLKAGLDALSNKNPMQALAIRNGMGEGTLDRHILTWAIATSGQPGIPSGEIAAAARELQGWPGLGSLRANSERALYMENPATDQVLAAFGSSQPETVEGSIILSRALMARGASAQAGKLIRKIWRDEPLDKPLEDKILAEFPSLLSPADHKARMDYLLYRDRTAQAKRFGDLGKAQSLYKAWAAVNDRSPR